MHLQFRNEILQSYASTGLQHRAVGLNQGLSQNETLFTDYFFTPEKKERTLIHISGTHGVEAYIGSLIQRDIAKENLRSLPFQVVIVHALNPYGMAHFRRVNALNVDLNRNALKSHHLNNPLFSRFQSFYRTGKQSDLWPILRLAFQQGLQKAIEVGACGQTDFPDSLFFSGAQLQPELISLRQVLSEIVAPRSHLYVLDVHSGLGAFSQETLIVDGFDGQEEQEFFKNCFQKSLAIPGQSRGVYRALGPLSSLLKETWLSFHIFQEFGTYSSWKVLKSLIHNNPEQVLETFFPANDIWRKRCREFGLLRFRQLVQTLSR